MRPLPFPTTAPAMRAVHQTWAWLAAACLATVLAAHAPRALAQTTGVANCGDPSRNHFGPWDYRTARKEDREIVERVHFTPGIENMTKPVNTMMQDMAQDVAYTLGVFPNHHRALLTMQRLSEKHRADPPPGTPRTVECWYDRAIRFRPDDNVARLLYVRWLHGRKRTDDARAQLVTAARIAGKNPLSQYNIGLVYLEIGDAERALEQAHRAMSLGMQRTELADLLKRQNAWRDPTP